MAGSCALSPPLVKTGGFYQRIRSPAVIATSALTASSSVSEGARQRRLHQRDMRLTSVAVIAARPTLQTRCRGVASEFSCLCAQLMRRLDHFRAAEEKCHAQRREQIPLIPAHSASKTRVNALMLGIQRDMLVYFEFWVPAFAGTSGCLQV